MEDAADGAAGVTSAGADPSEAQSCMDAVHLPVTSTVGVCVRTFTSVGLGHEVCPD